MSNLADYIEQFILRKLSAQQGNILMLRRNEIAEELNCAPSQISYVLSTRFTVSRGFLVESRRGSGGFIRIERILQQDDAEEDITPAQTKPDTEANLYQVLESMVRSGLITRREAFLIGQFNNILSTIPGMTEERNLLIRKLLLTLSLE